MVAPVARGFGRVVDDEFRTETFRKGVDFAAAAGAPVRAVAPGEVRFAGWFRGYGRIVILDHGDGYFTVSGHLDAVDVAVGDMVGEGDDLGTVGRDRLAVRPAALLRDPAGRGAPGPGRLAGKRPVRQNQCDQGLAAEGRFLQRARGDP